MGKSLDWLNWNCETGAAARSGFVMRKFGLTKLDTMARIGAALLRLGPIGEALQKDPESVEALTPHGSIRDILLNLGDCIMSAMFEIHPRVVYDVPYRLMQELGNAKADPSKLPSSLLRLPHPAIYVYSVVDSYRRGGDGPETMYDGPETVYDVWIGEHEHEGVRRLMFQSPTGYAVINLDKPTIGECIEAGGVPTVTGDLQGEDPADTFEFNIKLMVNLCLYLTGGDVEERPFKGNPHALSKQTGKRARANALRKSGICGVIGGKFLSAWTHYAATQSLAEEVGTGKSVRPHLRSGHWHLYWTGPGRTTPRVNFVHPCMVNAVSVDPSTEIERTVKLGATL